MVLRQELRLRQPVHVHAQVLSGGQGRGHQRGSARAGHVAAVHELGRICVGGHGRVGWALLTCTFQSRQIDICPEEQGNEAGMSIFIAQIDSAPDEFMTVVRKPTCLVKQLCLKPDTQSVRLAAHEGDGAEKGEALFSAGAQVKILDPEAIPNAASSELPLQA